MRDLIRVFWRSLLIQASWSFERMQSLGFSYAIEPVLKKLYPDPGEYESRMRLHLEYFNTQPYLASFILGATVRLEQDRAQGKNPVADIRNIKTSLMAPLGALGDSYFWGALRPFAAITATALLFTGWWWAPLFFLILFNFWHIRLRASVLFWGYVNSGDPVDLMDRYRFTKMAKLFKVLSLSLVGGIAAILPAWSTTFRPLVPLPGLFLAFAGMLLMLLFIVLLRKGGSPVKLMLGLVIVCLGLAFLGVV